MVSSAANKLNTVDELLLYFVAAAAFRCLHRGLVYVLHVAQDQVVILGLRFIVFIVRIFIGRRVAVVPIIILDVSMLLVGVALGLSVLFLQFGFMISVVFSPFGVRRYRYFVKFVLSNFSLWWLHGFAALYAHFMLFNTKLGFWACGSSSSSCEFLSVDV